MARQKGKVPERLRPYLFKKGHAPMRKRNPASKKRAVSRRKARRESLRAKSTSRYARALSRRKPHPELRTARRALDKKIKFVVTARQGKGPLLWLTRDRKFSNARKPRSFNTIEIAYKQAVSIARKYPVLLGKYQLAVSELDRKKMSGKT